MQTYSDFFRNEGSVRHYVDVVYRSDDYDAAIWDLQRRFLEKWLREFRKPQVRLKALDFACGTGRIASRLEPFTDEIVGLDISADMLEVAKTKTSRTDLRLGDILSEPGVVDYDYDLITAFRFFLNAEADLRARIMGSLAERLRDGRSRLIFNIHGNRHSIRHLALRMQGGRGTWRNEMSLEDVRLLTDAAGLEIEAWYGFGVLPRSVYRTRMSSVARRIDRFAMAARWPSRISCDLLFICRRKSASGGSS